MRFVSTALVMIAIALILLALMLLRPNVRANPTFVANLAGPNESGANGIPQPRTDKNRDSEGRRLCQRFHLRCPVFRRA
jgi:hypothetical protein